MAGLDFRHLVEIPQGVLRKGAKKNGQGEIDTMRRGDKQREEDERPTPDNPGPKADEVRAKT